MALYIYKAVTQSGRTVTGKIESVSKENVIIRLEKRGFSPVSVNEMKANYKTSKSKKNKVNNDSILKKERKKKNGITLKEAFVGTNIKPRDLIVFTENFYLLKKANFNNIHALYTLLKNTENSKLKEIIEDVLAGVEAGEYMYTTMEYYPDVFSYIYLNTIKVGELSGLLTESLGQVVTYLENTTKLKSDIRKILVPNILQFVLLVVMIFVGTLIAIPQIQKLFESVGSTDTLPAITLWFSGVINWMVDNWAILLGGFISIFLVLYLYTRTPKGKYRYHKFKYKIPVFGKLIFSLDLTNYLKAILLNLKNGMRVQDAIDVGKNVIKNFALLAIIESSKNNIINGESWIEPFEKSKLCPNMVTEMLKIGMQTDLTQMMDKIIEYMDMDIDNAIKRITRVLPQAVYVIIGILLILFVLIVLVPILQVYMGTFLFSAYGM
jgi:Type II secretory pathway, component PulF